VIGALAHGLPSILVPMGADQPLNAARCEALGVALVLDASTLRPETVRDAAAKVLRDPRYAERARALRAEIEALPAAADMVPHLERLGG
jgi:UDP:flavonoid glycosyltransferase YjiC (YdhE family)